MWIFIILILIGCYFIFIKPFLQQRDVENSRSYLSVPRDVQVLIDQEDVMALSTILVELELQEEYKACKIILDAIATRGMGFSRRVDRVRNEMRIEAGLGPLRYF